MNLRFWYLKLRPKRPFRISRETTYEKTTVLVGLEEDGLWGLGEAVPYPFYGDTLDAVVGFLKAAQNVLKNFSSFELHNVEKELHRLAGRNFSAKDGIMDAMFDLLGKRIGQPVWRMLGIPKQPVPTSYTIGIGSLDEMVADLEEHPNFQVYKVKLGTDKDLEIVKELAKRTDRPLRIDANAAWTPKEALRKIQFFADLGKIELVEQPLPPDDIDGLKFLKERSPLPIFVDESVMTSKDVVRVADAVDGINIKLPKSGGLLEAFRMIHVARAHGLKIMIGCMLQSSLGIAAAAQIAPLVDYVDLDGSLLLEADPCVGLEVDENGFIHLSEKPGLGIECPSIEIKL